MTSISFIRFSRHGLVRALATAALVLPLASGCQTTDAGSSASSSGATTNSSGSLAEQTGLGIGSALASLLYAPVKVAYAITGATFGALAWAYSGGDPEVADGVIVPAVYGDYVLMPDHLLRPDTIEFFGRRSGHGTNMASLPPVSAAAAADCASIQAMPTVHFEFARAALTQSAEGTVDFIAQRLHECPGLNVQIEAHTDWVGDPKYNLSLSERRAQVVRRHLVEHGVDESRLEYSYYGQKRPVAPNETSEGRALNRRVDLPVR